MSSCSRFYPSIMDEAQLEKVQRGLESWISENRNRANMAGYMRNKQDPKSQSYNYYFEETIRCLKKDTEAAYKNVCFAAIYCVRDKFLNIDVNLATYMSLKLLGEWAIIKLWEDRKDQEQLCLLDCFFVAQRIYKYIDDSGIFLSDDSFEDELEDVKYFCDEFSRADTEKLKQCFQEDIIDKWNRNIPVILEGILTKYEIRIQTVQESLCLNNKTFQSKYNIYADKIVNVEENESDNTYSGNGDPGLEEC